MRRFGLTIIFYFFLQISFCQKAGMKSYASYNIDWSVSKNSDSAFYLMYMVKQNDSVFSCLFYRKTGPMVKCETYNEPSLKVQHGIFAWYTDGKLDSTGVIAKGKRDGLWNYFVNNSEHKLIAQTSYESGSIKKWMNFINNQTILSDGTVRDIVSNDYSDTLVDKKAAFKNGNSGWMRFLENNINTPSSILDLYSVGTRFIVDVNWNIDPNGNVTNIFISHSENAAVDLESIRVIKRSPPWNPALKSGLKVSYPFSQSLTYVVGN